MNTEKKKKLQDAVHELRELYHRWIAEELQSSSKTYAEIGRIYGCSEQTVYSVARMHGISRVRAGADAQCTPAQGNEDAQQ